eukprot:196773_1
MDEIILDLSNKSIQQIDAIQHCIPGQFTKSEHIKAAYYDSPLLDTDTTSTKWKNLLDIQTDCTIRWIQHKFEQAASKPSWKPDIWFNAQNERNNSVNYGVCDGNYWFKFVDTLNIGPYITHPWTPTLTAFIAKQIIEYMNDKNKINILDVGCGIGEFGTKLNEVMTENIAMNIDGMDRSENSLNRLKLNGVYRNGMYIDLCDENDFETIKQKMIQEDDLYDIIVSSDCLQMTYGKDYSPGSKAVQDLMDLVKPNGYFLIVTTLQSVSTYNVVCMFDDILKDKWNEHGFECIADLTVRGFGDFVVEYVDEYEQNSVENNICFVKLMKRVA